VEQPVVPCGFDSKQADPVHRFRRSLSAAVSARNRTRLKWSSYPLVPPMSARRRQGCLRGPRLKATQSPGGWGLKSSCANLGRQSPGMLPASCRWQRRIVDQQAPPGHFTPGDAWFLSSFISRSFAQ
jgi:hypothetical protein